MTEESHAGAGRTGSLGRVLIGCSAAARAGVSLGAELVRIGLGRSELAPERGDKRFRDATWSDNVYYPAAAAVLPGLVPVRRRRRGQHGGGRLASRGQGAVPAGHPHQRRRTDELPRRQPCGAQTSPGNGRDERCPRDPQLGDRPGDQRRHAVDGEARVTAGRRAAGGHARRSREPRRGRRAHPVRPDNRGGVRTAGPRRTPSDRPVLLPRPGSGAELRGVRDQPRSADVHAQLAKPLAGAVRLGPRHVRRADRRRNPRGPRPDERGRRERRSASVPAGS